MNRNGFLMSGLALLLVVAGAGCKDNNNGNNNPVGPGGVSFPDLPSAVLSEFCYRGNALVGQTKSGTLSSSDCDAGDSYYEIWRVRVASATSVTFDLNSVFDNWLTIVRLDGYTSSSADFSIIGENDDRSNNNLNAMLTVTLQPGIDYFVSVSGYDYSETGSYTLQIR
jgi:hypothetical protein